MGIFDKEIEINTDTDVAVDECDLETKRIILYNDDYNTFDYVIKCLLKYCKHDKTQAEQCVHIIHIKGKCSIKEGDISELKPIKESLCDNGLDAKIE